MNTATQTAQPVTVEALNKFLAQVQQIHTAYVAKLAPNTTPDVVTFTEGTKYLRIVKGHENGTGRSVYCFVDRANGNIYKAASWRAPERNYVRGNIHDPESVAQWCGPYGVNSVK